MSGNLGPNSFQKVYSVKLDLIFHHDPVCIYHDFYLMERQSMISKMKLESETLMKPQLTTRCDPQP